MNQSQSSSSSNTSVKEDTQNLPNIYIERRKSFLSALDSVLGNLKIFSKENILEEIEELIINNLTSEREYFYMQAFKSIEINIKHNTKLIEKLHNFKKNVSEQHLNIQNSSLNQNMITLPKDQFNELFFIPLYHISKIQNDINEIKINITSQNIFFSSFFEKMHKKTKAKILNEFQQMSQIQIQLKQKYSQLRKKFKLIQQQNSESKSRTERNDRLRLNYDNDFDEKPEKNVYFTSPNSPNIQSFKSQIFTSPNSPNIQSFKSQIFTSPSTPEFQITRKKSRYSSLSAFEINDSPDESDFGINQHSPLKTEIKKLNFIIDARDTKISSLEKTIKLLEDKNNLPNFHNIIEESKSKTEHIHYLQNQIKEMQNQIKDLQGYYAEAQKLKEQIDIKTEENDEIKEMFLNEKKSALQLANNNKGLSREIDNYKIQVSDLERQIKDLNKDIDNALEINDLKENKNKELLTKLSELKKQLADKEDLKKQMSIKDNKLVKRKIKLESQQNQIEYLKKIISIKDNDLIENKTIIKSQQNQIEDLKEQISIKDNDLNENKTINKSQQNQIEDLNEQISFKDNELIESKNTIKSQQDQLRVKLDLELFQRINYSKLVKIQLYP